MHPSQQIWVDGSAKKHYLNWFEVAIFARIIAFSSVINVVEFFCSIIYPQCPYSASELSQCAKAYACGDLIQTSFQLISHYPLCLMSSPATTSMPIINPILLSLTLFRVQSLHKDNIII